MKEQIKVHIFHCGEVGVDPAVPFKDISRRIMISEEEFKSVKKGNIRYRNRFWKDANIEYLTHDTDIKPGAIYL